MSSFQKIVEGIAKLENWRRIGSPTEMSNPKS